MAMTIQDALKHFNVGLGQWYGWKKVDDDGSVIPNDQRMSYRYLVIHNPSAVKPTEQEINNKIAAYPLQELREKRNVLLAETDWMAFKDVTLPAAWKTYRQALRDLPATANPTLDENGQLTNITWPTKPK